MTTTNEHFLASHLHSVVVNALGYQPEGLQFQSCER